MVGRQLKRRDGEIWDFDRGVRVQFLNYGEYTWTNLPDRREEVENFWTRERWILEKGEQWMGGPYYRRGKHMYSFRNPELVIGLSEKAMQYPGGLSTLAGRPVYYDGVETVLDAVTDAALFDADCCWRCDAGFLVAAGDVLYFTDGVRKNLPMGDLDWNEDVEFLRVSETVYSIKLGAGRNFVLDTARWTCRTV